MPKSAFINTVFVFEQDRNDIATLHLANRLRRAKVVLNWLVDFIEALYQDLSAMYMPKSTFINTVFVLLQDRKKWGQELDQWSDGVSKI